MREDGLSSDNARLDNTGAEAAQRQRSNAFISPYRLIGKQKLQVSQKNLGHSEKAPKKGAQPHKPMQESHSLMLLSHKPLNEHLDGSYTLSRADTRPPTDKLTGPFYL